MAWTKDEMQDHVIDQIIKLIMENRYHSYFYNESWQLDLNNFRRTVSSSGYLSTGTITGNKKQVIFQEDFQNLGRTDKHEAIANFVDAVATCQWDGTYEASTGDYMYQDPFEGQSDDWVDTNVLAFNWHNWSTEPQNEDGLFGIPNCNEAPCTADIVWTGTCPNSTIDGEWSVSIQLTTPIQPPNNNDPSILDYLSQIVPLSPTKTQINPVKAKEVLDTTIYELLPGTQTRQERIDKFFSEYGKLKSGEVPNWDQDGDQVLDSGWDVGDPSGDSDDHPTSNDYSDIYDIANPNHTSVGFITRLNRHAVDTYNQNKTLQWLRDDINNYLEDIDYELTTGIPDERPNYKDNAEGYLKFRGLNQSIIVRSETDTTGLETYQDTGFTIAMWVRFIDKKTGGTLFNYGAPMADGSTFGFMLETFTIGKDDLVYDPDYDSTSTWAGDAQAINEGLFNGTSHERFVRLVVREGDGMLRDSHVGSTYQERIDTSQYVPHAYGMIGNPKLAGLTYEQNNSQKVLTHTRIPTDRNEWYYIVANYNPVIDEDTSYSYIGTTNCNYDGSCTGDGCDAECKNPKNSPNFWRWNSTIGTPGDWSPNSTLGARCKVEIISKSDLLRARGYKT